MSVPAISVVIPTHNRRECLLLALDALCSQRLPGIGFEVIVVADGCTDGTEQALHARSFPFELRIITQPNAGAAAARNRGAAAARGGVLLFLDDDVLLSRGALAAHLQAHDGDEVRAGVGPYLLDPPEPGDYLGEQLYEFWRRTFAAMAEPGRAMGPRDCLSGNLSVAARAFASVGGFDAAFPACGIEDYELGMRLIKAGVRLVYVPDALGRHLETTDLARSLQRNLRAPAWLLVLAWGRDVVHGRRARAAVDLRLHRLPQRGRAGLGVPRRRSTGSTR
jgi:GT2 family glycosyltransferase